MTSDGPIEEPVPFPARPEAADTRLTNSMGRHPTAVGRHLDSYLGAVARELGIRGVLTGAPHRNGPEQRLIGSIVLDCTALRVAAWAPRDDRPDEHRSVGAAIPPEHPAPVIVTWNEDLGWSVGLHHDPSNSSRRYLHPDLLPTAETVADFVVGLALGRPLGSSRPINTSPFNRPPLRLIR